MPLNAGVKKICRNGRGFKLSIPRHVVDALNWPIGTTIYMQINPDDTVTLAALRAHPIEPTPLDANARALIQKKGPIVSPPHA